MGWGTGAGAWQGSHADEEVGLAEVSLTSQASFNPQPGYSLEHVSFVCQRAQDEEPSR